MKIAAYLGGSRGYEVLSSLLVNHQKPEFVFVKLKSKSIETIETCKLNSIYVEEIDGKFLNSHIDSISSKDIDIFVVSGFNSILPAEILKLSKYGGINCHAGRLPMYRGAAIIPWQIINGEVEGEAYVLEMTPGIDDGHILEKEKYFIGVNETSKHIVEKVNTIFSKLVPKVINSYSLYGSDVHKTNQADVESCTWTQRFPKDGLIEWGKLTAIEVVNLVRALDDPYPGAFTYINGKKVIIKKAIVHPELIKGVSSRYVGIRSGKITVIASDRAVAILDYNFIDENNLRIEDLLKSGDMFGSN